MTIDLLDTKVEEMITNQIKYVRKMSLLSDEQMRLILQQQIMEHPSLVDNYKETEQKKIFNDISKMSRNINADPRKIARKVI